MKKVKSFKFLFLLLLISFTLHSLVLNQSSFNKKYNRNYLIANFLAVTLVALPMETIGYHVFKIWEYHPWVGGTLILPYFLPWQMTVDGYLRDG